MKKVARMLRSHRDLILIWFRTRGQLSAGAVEGLNGKVRVITKRACGFRTYRAVEVALYQTLGHLPVPDVTHRLPTDSAEEPDFEVRRLVANDEKIPIWNEETIVGRFLTKRGEAQAAGSDSR
jgi:hypothetical protein